MSEVRIILYAVLRMFRYGARLPPPSKEENGGSARVRRTAVVPKAVRRWPLLKGGDNWRNQRRNEGRRGFLSLHEAYEEHPLEEAAAVKASWLFKRKVWCYKVEEKSPILQE